jgi:hypothetical protein
MNESVEELFDPSTTPSLRATPPVPGVHYVRKKGQSLNWRWSKQRQILKGDWPQ